MDRTNKTSRRKMSPLNPSAFVMPSSDLPYSPLNTVNNTLRSTSNSSTDDISPNKDSPTSASGFSSMDQSDSFGSIRPNSANPFIYQRPGKSTQKPSQLIYSPTPVSSGQKSPSTDGVNSPLRSIRHSRALSSKTTPLKAIGDIVEKVSVFSECEDQKRESNSTSCPELSTLDGSVYSDSPAE